MLISNLELGESAGNISPGGTADPEKHTSADYDCAYFTTRFTGPINPAADTSMVSSTPIFDEFLNKKGIKYEKRNVGKCHAYIFEHTIPHGRYTGKTVTVALPIPTDFPITAPYGFHVKSNHVFTDAICNTGPSPLGSEWQFWSRQVNIWNTRRQSPQYYFDHVNRWLELT